MKAFFFAVIIGLLALIKVNALGYICKRHIVIKHGDRCRFYNGAPNPDYRIKFSEIYHLNPSKYKYIYLICVYIILCNNI